MKVYDTSYFLWSTPVPLLLSDLHSPLRFDCIFYLICAVASAPAIATAFAVIFPIARFMYFLLVLDCIYFVIE